MNSDDEAPNLRARWLGVLLILVALGAVIWQALESGWGDAPPPSETELAREGPLSLSEMLASVDAAKLGREAAASAAGRTVLMTASAAPDEIEVCGIGRVKADAAGEPVDTAQIDEAAAQARTRLLPILLKSSDETARAAGLLLQSVGAPGQAEAGVPYDMLARDNLARMALASNSPQVYAWAMRACQGQRGAGMCQMLSAEQWARLEPGNAVAWLQVGADAQARRDSAAVAEALYRVSLANRLDLHRGGLTGVVLSQLPADVTLLAKGALTEQLRAFEAEQALPHMVASQHCSAEAVRDSNRHQVCESLAEVFSSQANTLGDLDIAAFIGERAGWPAKRLREVQNERDAIQQLQTVRAAQPRWSCPAIDRDVRQLAESSVQGELAVMRRALKESPDDVVTLARRYREAADATTAKRAEAGASAPMALAGS